MRTNSPVANKSYERLSCRVNVRIKHQAEEAACILGQSMTDFTEADLCDRRCLR
jgi:uncharacterized protein (DUF1778 family)